MKESFGSRIRNFVDRVIPPPTDGKRESLPSLDVMNLRNATSMYSQPVFGPEISGAGAYAHEGYTSRAFETPTVRARIQVDAMKVDEDISLALNQITSQITGGKHYWSSKFQEMTDYLGRYSKAVSFDWFDTILVKECLGYGNSFWKPRNGIENIRSKDDLMHIPFSSFQRVWWDRQRRPYRYEFRGPEYQGYHDPYQIMHFIWNPVDGSVLGTGLITALTAIRAFTEITPQGPKDKQRPSLLDMKLSTQLTMAMAEKRYIPRNVYNAVNASAKDRANMKTTLDKLDVGEDFVVGSKVEVQELGSVQRAFDPTRFTDNVLGPIQKALNNFRGKQAQESSHQFANAKTSAILDEVGLSSFPHAIQRQIQDQWFKPWYMYNQIYSPEYGGGMIGIDYEEAEPTIEFGEMEKKDMEPEIMQKLIESAVTTGAVLDPLEKRKLYERAGLPMADEFTDQIEQLANQQAMEQQMMQQQQMAMLAQQGQQGPPMKENIPNWNTYGPDHARRPMDSKNYRSEPVTPYQKVRETRPKYSREPYI